MVLEGLVTSYDTAKPVNLSLLPKPKCASTTGPKAGTEGDRNNTLNRRVFAAALKNDLSKIEEAKKEALDVGLTPSEVNTTSASAQAAAVNIPVFHRKDDVALMSALESMNVAIRYNLRTQNGEIRNGAELWKGMTDRNAGFLRAEIARKCRYDTDKGPRALHYGESSWALYTNAVMHRFEIDPFLVWLEGLAPWDGVERVKHLAIRLL